MVTELKVTIKAVVENVTVFDETFVLTSVAKEIEAIRRKAKAISRIFFILLSCVF